jgi:hypothetical protein
MESGGPTECRMFALSQNRFCLLPDGGDNATASSSGSRFTFQSVQSSSYLRNQSNEMEFILRCNDLKCRAQLHDQAVVTTCRCVSTSRVWSDD